MEDNPNDIELTLHAFKKNKLTNRIHVVRDGAEALEFLFATGAYAGRDSADWPKVILLDIKLPKVDGLEVLRQIKKDPRTRTIRSSCSPRRGRSGTSSRATGWAATATSSSRWSSISSRTPFASWGCTGCCSTGRP